MVAGAAQEVAARSIAATGTGVVDPIVIDDDPPPPPFWVPIFDECLFFSMLSNHELPGNTPQSFETPRRMLTPHWPLVWHRLRPTITAFEYLG